MCWKMCFTRNRTSVSNPWLEEWIHLSFGIDWTQSKRPNKWRYRGFTQGPNVWLWYQVMRLRQTGVITAIESVLATVMMWTKLHWLLNYSKSFQDAPYSDLWTQCRKQHTTAWVHPGKAPPSRLTVSVCLVPSGALRWHLQPLRGKCFGERRSLSPLLPIPSCLPCIWHMEGCSPFPTHGPCSARWPRVWDAPGSLPRWRTSLCHPTSHWPWIWRKEERKTNV